MTAFLFYTFALICLGIFIRIFWIPLAVVGAILGIVLGIIVCAGTTALVFTILGTVCTNGELVNFSTYFAYSSVFYTVMTCVYIAIVGDLVGMLLSLFRK